MNIIVIWDRLEIKGGRLAEDLALWNTRYMRLVFCARLKGNAEVKGKLID